MKRVITTLMMIVMLAMSARAEVIAEIHTDGMENAIEITEPCPATSTETAADAPGETETAQKVYGAITHTDDEKILLAAILWAEANNQPDSGKEACVEVVLNRILSDDWPDDLVSVLSQRGQFATWKYRNKVHPTQSEYDAIEKVLVETETVLPDLRYVYFDTKGKNGKAHIRIKDHVFGR